MAGGDISVAEAGLRIAERNVPQANTVHEMIYEAASKSIAEGNATKAAETIKNPGRTLSEETGKKRIKQVLKNDNLDQNGQPSHSQEQRNRQTVIEELNKTIIKCREIGYGRLQRPQQQLLRNTLATALFDHPAIREVAKIKIPNVDVTSQAFRNYCNDTAENLLSNQQIGEKMANGLVDVLEEASIDYTALLQNLETQKELNKTVSDLTKEIGNDGTNNQPRDGLNKKIADQTSSVNKYKTKVEIDPNTHLPRVVPESNDPNAPAKIKLDAELRLKAGNESVELTLATIDDVDSYFADGKHSTYSNVVDPENTARKITIKRGEWSAKKINWSKKVKEFEVQRTKDQQLIDKIEADDVEAKEKLVELETTLKSKKTELEGFKKTLAEKIKEIEKSRDINETDSVANKEQEIIESIKRMMVQESLDVWSLGVETTGKVMPDVMKQIETEITNKAKELLREDVYDAGKKKFRKNRLNAQLDTLLSNGVDGYGLNNLQSLFVQCNNLNAPPEMKKFLPVIKEMVDFSQNPPKVLNQEKVKAYGSDIIGDMLKMVAYKDPKALERRFSQDERAMAVLKGDILPTLIESAMKDTTLKSAVEQSLGVKLTTRNGIENALKHAKWGEIIKWLLIAIGVIGGGALGFTALSHFIPH